MVLNSDEKFRLLVEAVKDYAIFILDREGRVATWNEGAKHIKGYESSEIIGQHFSKFYTQADLRENLPAKELEICSKTGRFEDEGWRIRKDGSKFWAHVIITPLRDNGKNIIGFSKVTRDLTERKKSEDALKEANASLEQRVRERTSELKAANQAIVHSAKFTALGEMAGGIAHEINNPLAIISENANLLSDLLDIMPINTEAIKMCASKIDETVLRIAKIIEGLRSFAREGSNEPKEVCPISKIVDDTLEFCKEKFRVNKISLTVSDIPDSLVLRCHSVQISQVLLNLLNNAYQAIEQKTEKWIKLDVTSRNNRIIISVTDSGGGIRPEIQEKLFQPFYTTKPIGKGTGLGLSISKGIIESHNGELNIDRECLDTRFVINLPRDISNLEMMT